MLGIVGTSKTIIIVAQILGVLVVVVLGYFISKSISKVLGALIGETKRLSTAAVEGKLQTRGNPESVSLEFRPIVENVNAAMDVFTGFIDHIPSPFMTMNKDREILYMNDCVATVIGLDKRQIEGTKCYEHFKTTHCNTPECACVRAMEQRCAVTAETTARPAGRELEISYVGLPIKDGGGKVVGVMEFVTDLTAVKRAAKVTAKVSDFQSQQSRTLTQNLEKLSAGDFNLALEVAEGDADTAAARESFLQIAGAVKQVVETLRGMTADAKKLRQAATEGKLDVRADEARYDGEYRQIIHGINETLAGFEKPIHEIAEVLTRLAAKDFTRTVGSQYPGLYGRLRDNVNQVVTNMRTAIEQITETAAQFGEGSRVVAEGSQTMAQGAQTQSASVEEMTASVEELTRSIDDRQGQRRRGRQDRQADQPTGRRRRSGRAKVRGSHGPDSHQLATNQRNHPSHFRNRQPDEPAGAERRHRGRPGRRTRHGIRRGGRRGPQTRRTLQPGRPRNFHPHQGVDAAAFRTAPT